MNILIADDDATMVQLLVILLQEKSCRVLKAYSAKDVISILEHESVDLLVTDLVMPDTQGASLIRQVYALRPELPIILISGYDWEDIVRDDACPPVTGYWHKGAPLSELLELIQERRLFSLQHSFLNLDI